MARRGNGERVAPKKQWRESEARAVMSAWEKSGKSGSAFARSIGVGAQRLFWWRQRLSRSTSETTAFVPVVTRLAERTAPALIVTTDKGVRIEVNDVDASTAAWVLALLGGGAGS